MAAPRSSPPRRRCDAARSDALDVDAHAWGHRRRGRVDHEEHAHGGEPYRPAWRLHPDPSPDPRLCARSTARSSTCRACPRLVEWREQVAREKRASFRDDDYWGRPVPGFGDPRARVLVAGLAPAAHGGQPHRPGVHRRPLGRLPLRVAVPHRLRQPADRQSRPTTGWSCATPTSPPRCGARRRPTSPRPSSATRCLPYLERELDLLDRGRASSSCSARSPTRPSAGCSRPPASPLPTPRPRFAHGLEVPTARAVVLGCFHPSQQNTFTGKLTEPMIDDVFLRARELADAVPSRP